MSTNFIIHFMLSFLLSLIFVILTLFDSIREYSDAFLYFFRLIPSAAFGTGIARINYIISLRAIKNDKTLSASDNYVAGTDIIYLSVMGFAYFFIILIVE